MKLEVFPSDQPVQACAFHVYNLISSNLMDSPFKVIRGACRTLANCNASIGIFENGKQILSTAEISNIPEKGVDFRLEYQGMQRLDILQNKWVYEAYIRFLIREKLKMRMVFDKYRKYKCNSEITSCWFPDGRGGYTVYECSDRSIRLERVYKIKIEICDDGRAYLWLDIRSNFNSRLNVMDLINRHVDVCGMEVKNSWSNFRQSGIITEVSDKTVVDKMDFGYSLKGYYVEKKSEAARVENLPDHTPVVKVKLERSDAELPYYPQALEPIITREYMARYDAEFSNRIDPLVKRPMNERLVTDGEFITDIGALEEIGGLRFETDCCGVRCLGFSVWICEDAWTGMWGWHLHFTWRRV